MGTFKQEVKNAQQKENLTEARAKIDSIQAEINQNYQTAIMYYQMKRQAYLNQISANIKKVDQQKINKAMDRILEEIQDKILEEWKKISSQLTADLVGTKNTLRSGSGYQNFSDSKYLSRQELLDFAENVGQQSYQLTLGNIYERFLENAFRNLGSNISKRKKSIVNNILTEFFNSMRQTGNLYAQEGIRGSQTDKGRTPVQIRADIANFTLPSTSETTYTEAEGQIAELKAAFNLQTAQNQEDLLNNDILRQYLTGKYAGFGGFSIKTWPGKDWSGHKVTSASGMKLLVEDAFAEGYPHTWNAFYAQATVNKILSRYILNIQGPQTIGYITGSEVLWMDEFLSQYMFSMNVYAYARGKSPKEKDTNELVLPYVRDNIYIYKKEIFNNYNESNITWSKSSFKAKGKSDRYFRVEVKGITRYK